MNYSNKTKKELLSRITRLEAELAALRNKHISPETEAGNESAAREARYREMVEQLPQIIFEADADSRITFANQAAFKAFGYSRQEFNEGINISQIITPEDIPRVLENIQNLLAGKEIGHPVYMARRKDGSVFPIQDYSTPIIKEGKPVGLRGIVIDITELKRAEKIQKALYGISNALTTTNKMRDLYKQIKEHLSEVLDTTNFYVALYDEKKDLISLPYISDEKDNLVSFPPGKTLSAYVIKTGKALLADKKSMKELTKKGLVEIIGTPAEVWLGVPLKLQEKIIGLLAVQSYDNPNLYTERDKEILTFVSEGIAIAIKHKQASESIRQSEERYRKLFNSSKDAIMTLAPPDWKFTSGNPTILEMFKVKSIEEFTALGPWNVSPEYQEDGRPSEQKAREMIMAAMEKGSNYFEWLHQRLHGEIFPATVLLTRVDLGESVFLQATVRDITLEKKALEALRESEERFRRLFEDLGDAVFVTKIGGPDRGLILEVNPSAEKQTGYSKRELIGMNLEKDLSVEESETLSYEEWDQKLQNREVVTTVEKKRKKDGSIYWTEVVVTAIEYKGIKAGLSINHDITQKKLLEEQLRQSQKMEAVGQLAGGVAHDFNNLLTVINGYCDLLSMRELPKEIINPITQIHNAGKKATQLTSQLLAFSRKQIIQPKILNLNTLLSDSMKMLGRLLGENIEVSTNLASELAYIKADPGQLEQTIMNIAINASDAMPFGGKLTIETANANMDETYSKTHPEIKPGKYVMLAISDSGVGMDAATRKKIFEPFFTTKGRGKGTGLGLATVYGIVKQNHGFIYVYSEPQKGSTFKIYLPQAAKQQEKEENNINIPIDLQGSETILLVEDESAVREVASSTLAELGYNVITASNGEEAIRLYHRYRQKIDLLLTDVVMPLMNGKELAVKICADNKNMKVLFSSGYTDNNIARHGVLDEGMQFIQKPYSHIELAQKVREVLRS